MKVTELRIGNWANYSQSFTPVDFTILKIGAISGIENVVRCVEDNIYSIDTIYPIPLTAEILEMAGFEYDGATTLSKDNSPLYFKILNGKGSAFVQKLNQPHEVHCEYVHQLQNLYFALTGEELQIENVLQPQ